MEAASTRAGFGAADGNERVGLGLMREATKTDPITLSRGAVLPSQRLLFAFAGLFLFNLLLRVFYLRYDFVSGDEAVRAITASEMLEGARLYADIVTDKPPGATLFYAAVFALFGRSMAAVHLAAAAWNFATAVVLYLTAARVHGRRAGLWAALLFVYFSTNYLTHDMMAANTELLMALPYTASFYCFLSGQGRRALVAAGLFSGVALLFKQVAVFNLFFFILYEALAAGRAKNRRIKATRRSLARLLLIGLGFVIAPSLAVLWLAATGTLDDFWRYVVALGGLYAGALSAATWVEFMAGRTLGYVAFNAALWWPALWAAARAVREFNRGSQDKQDIPFDLAAALWGAASLAAVFVSGRFFGHYFIQVLPALSLLGARGVGLLGERLRDPARRRGALWAAAALLLLFVLGFVRFHQRTAVLAYETVTGADTRYSQPWGMTGRQREAERVAAALRGSIGEGEALYIWGYALDVYWRTRCRPATRYLAPYYVTGQFPELEGGPIPPDNEFWRESRALLIEDLGRARPRLILDVQGNLLSLPYPELTHFIKKNYREDGRIGPYPDRPFVVYRLKGEEEVSR